MAQAPLTLVPAHAGSPCSLETIIWSHTAACSTTDCSKHYGTAYASVMDVRLMVGEGVLWVEGKRSTDAALSTQASRSLPIQSRCRLTKSAVLALSIGKSVIGRRGNGGQHARDGLAQETSSWATFCDRHFVGAGAPASAPRSTNPNKQFSRMVWTLESSGISASPEPLTNPSSACTCYASHTKSHLLPQVHDLGAEEPTTVQNLPRPTNRIRNQQPGIGEKAK